MRINTKDDTLKKNYIQTYQYLIKEYEAVKNKEHGTYETVTEFYKAHNTCRQTFLKYYARYKQSNDDVNAFLPRKRGPKYKTRRIGGEIEKLVIEARDRGCNRYEIHSILKPQLGIETPSPSGIYKVLVRNSKNKLTPKMQETKRQIIKTKAGELGHIDCHHLSKDIIIGTNKKYYLVCVIDSCSRIAWAEVIDDIKSLTVTFAVLRCLNYMVEDYEIKFAEVLTDNGPEFGPRFSKAKDQHPFERLLKELEITHRYTRPYRPQTNGKVERFWRTLNEDLINETHFESIEAFKNELFQYLLYYNTMRPHQGIDGKTPSEVAANVPRMVPKNNSPVSNKTNEKQ